MKIYVILEQYFECTSICGLYKDENKAKDEVIKLKDNKDSDYKFYEVKEYEVVEDSQVNEMLE